MLRRTLLTIPVFAFAAPAPAQLSLTQVGNGFNQPLFVTAAPGTPASTFLDLPSIRGPGQVLTAGEQGLLGMAFGPGFANGNGFVYVDYVGNNATTQGE